MNQDAPWIVKGGYGFEVRYGMDARTTKDIDLALPEISSDAATAQGTIQKLWEDLQEATAHDVGDHFVIRIGAPQQEFDAPPGGGARFPVEVLLDQRTFATVSTMTCWHWLTLLPEDRPVGHDPVRIFAFAGMLSAIANLRILQISQNSLREAFLKLYRESEQLTASKISSISGTLMRDKCRSYPNRKHAIQVPLIIVAHMHKPITIPAPPTLEVFDHLYGTAIQSF